MEERPTKMDCVWTERVVMEKNVSKTIPKFLME